MAEPRAHQTGDIEQVASHVGQQHGRPTVIGVTLVAATLVIPAVVARMLSNSFSRMLWLSTAIGTACGMVGMNASYHLDVPPAPPSCSPARPSSAASWR